VVNAGHTTWEQFAVHIAGLIGVTPKPETCDDGATHAARRQAQILCAGGTEAPGAWVLDADLAGCRAAMDGLALG
jgi:hypothetical protein